MLKKPNDETTFHLLADTLKSLANTLNICVKRMAKEQLKIVAVGLILGIIAIVLVLESTSIQRAIIAGLAFIIIAYLLGFSVIRSYKNQPNESKTERNRLFYDNYHKYIKAIINKSKKV